MRDTPCLNCGELVKECACWRNRCIICGAPVGNITFTACDDCWDKKLAKTKTVDPRDAEILALRAARDPVLDDLPEVLGRNAAETLIRIYKEGGSK